MAIDTDEFNPYLDKIDKIDECLLDGESDN